MNSDISTVSASMMIKSHNQILQASSQTKPKPNPTTTSFMLYYMKNHDAIVTTSKTSTRSKFCACLMCITFPRYNLNVHSCIPRPRYSSIHDLCILSRYHSSEV